MDTVHKSDTANLPPGTRVGGYCLVALRGQGSYGAVYQAVRVGLESTGPVALKLALRPEDARFAREAELLSRLLHPGVPRLYDSGQWRHPSGATYPYLAMQWVQGRTLYEWAELHIPSSRQAMRVFAQVARALQATHEVGGVHRDVKGANVLVRQGDGRVFLTDFGSGRHEGAAPLTSHALPPGTPIYRAPGAWLCVRNPDGPGRYSPGPADDVFALGITAWRLIVGRYPAPTHPDDEDSYIWYEPHLGPYAPGDFNRLCHPELSALVLRMLSKRPEARGSARELAEALEAAACSGDPALDTPLWARAVVQLPPVPPKPELVPPVPPKPEPEPVRPEPAPSHEAPSVWRTWGPALAAVLAVLMATRSEAPEAVRASRPQPESQEQRDAGTVGVADDAPEDSEDAQHGLPPGERIAQQPPPNPRPGQLAPDASGRCRNLNHVSLNGGCWVLLQVKDPQKCKDDGFVEYQGECYLPIIPPRNTPVSSPAAQDAPP